MPTWTKLPPDGQTKSGLTLVRAPAARPFYAIAVSTKLIGCPTHFYHGRTFPCEPPNCPACQEGFGWRWHAYLACIVQDTHELVIFECTAQAADAFQNYQEAHRTLRGCSFKAFRLGQKTNGRLVIHTQPADLATLHLPPEPDVPKVLCHIWNVSDKKAGTVPGRPGRPKIVTNATDDGNGQTPVDVPVRPPQSEHPR